MEKHGCRITFGVDSWTGIDPEFKEFAKYTEGVYRELTDKGELLNGVIDMTKFWFQLYDPKNEKRHYHYLEYSEGSQVVDYEKYAWEELSEKTQEFLDENDNEYSMGDKVTLYTRLGGTVMKGFAGFEKPNVYREGMLLKFFGDLVCDYLKEERIVRTY